MKINKYYCIKYVEGGFQMKYVYELKKLRKLDDTYYLLGKKDNKYYCIYKNDIEVNGMNYLLVIYFNNSIILDKIFFDFVIDVFDIINNVHFKVEKKYYAN